MTQVATCIRCDYCSFQRSIKIGAREVRRSALCRNPEVRHAVTRDPVSGEQAFKEPDGKLVFGPYPVCSAVNTDGNCEHFKARGSR